MAILNKLYEIAEMIWQKMVRNYQGSYRASEIEKNLYKSFFWGEEISMYQPICVEVDSFRCEFTAGHIFRLVSKFESLAGIGKKAHMFTYQEENEKERGCVCFQATKEMVELCDFVYNGKDRGVLLSIFLDAERSRLVATDTHKLLAMPVTITNKSGDTRDMLIDAKTWKKMCAKMKPGKVYDLVAVKLDNREEATVIEFEGLTSYEPSPCRFVDWASCFGTIFDGYCVHIGGSWDAIRKMIYSVSSEDYVSLSGRKGEKVITVKKGENVATFATDEVLKHSFSLSFDTEHILPIPQLDILYLGINEKTLKMAESENGNVYLLCPRNDGDSYIGEKVADGVYDAGEPGKGVKLLQKTCEITVSAVAEKKAVLSSEKKKKPVDDSRKFAFDKIGIEPGDIITFIHGGQSVITIDNNKVVYQGKVYTLSGFCKEFMPDDRRNKANSYRGCAFFAYKGVKLDKMFKEALKAKAKGEDVKVCKEENACEVITLTTVPSDSIAGQDQSAVSPSHTLPPSDSRFKPVCGYFASSPIIVPFERDKGLCARKIHYLVGVAAHPMPPPGNEKKLLPLQGDRGAPMITQGAALG